MPIRIPFTRRHDAGVAVVGGEASLRPGSSAGADPSTGATSLPHAQEPHLTPSFERVDTVGSSARSRKSQDTGEYKMSVVNDSGVYLPPSPTEREATWSARRYLPRPSTDTIRSGHSATAVSSTGEIEAFSISRESFDSYRRSFDISARSPIIANDLAPTRMSLDSAARPSHLGTKKYRPKSSLRDVPSQFKWEPPSGTPADEGFEDVGLNDDNAAAAAAASAGHGNRFLGGMSNSASNSANYFNRKRTGFLSKFGSDHFPEPASPTENTPTSGGTAATPPASSNSGVSRFLMSTRKRASSGQGAELTSMDRPSTAKSTETQEAQT